MSPFVHFARHAPRAKGEKLAVVHVAGPGEVVYKNKRFDLRTGTAGAPFPGFYPAPDGVMLAWKEGRVHALHPDGKDVRIDHPLAIDPKGLGPTRFAVVGRWLIASERPEKPWLVFDLGSGALLGPLEGQGLQPFSLAPMYAPLLPPEPHATLWLGELERLVEWVPETRQIRRVVPAPAGHLFVTFSVMADRVVVNLRPVEAHKAYRRAEDRVAAFDFEGKLLWSHPTPTMSVAAVGSRVVASAAETMKLVVFDADGAVVQELPFIDPNTKMPFALVRPLPGGREFLTVGGNSEWDHWGEAELRAG
jgi:hypothetical protein